MKKNLESGPVEAFIQKKKLSKGKIITISDVNFLRPGNNLSCSEFYKINKRKLKKTILPNSPINLNDF